MGDDACAHCGIASSRKVGGLATAELENKPQFQIQNKSRVEDFNLL